MMIMHAKAGRFQQRKLLLQGLEFRPISREDILQMSHRQTKKLV